LVLCFSPWLLVVGKIAAVRGGLESNIGSFARPDVADVVGYYALLNGPSSTAWGVIVGQILFASPILWWGWQLRTRTAPDKGTVFTFWSLAAFSTLPIVSSYVASRLLPQSVWGTRFLVIAAVPYLLLVAAATNRLSVRWLRQATAACILGWSALTSYAALNNTDKRAWEPLVYRMIQMEPAQGPNISIYAFGSSDETIAFYLRKAQDTRFRTTRVFELGDFAGEHFWVASRSRDEVPQQFFRSRGYQVGEGLSDGFGALLSPVWRR